MTKPHPTRSVRNPVGDVRDYLPLHRAELVKLEVVQSRQQRLVSTQHRCRDVQPKFVDEPG